MQREGTRSMKLKFYVAIMALMFSLLIANDAFAYTVKSGDTLWKVSQSQGVSLDALRKANNKWDNSLQVGQNLIIPTSTATGSTSVSVSDKDLLARLVSAEAKGEPYAGQVAVATVVLNRVDSAGFPNTISGVINETYENGKYYAFSPVENGTIKQPAPASAKKAVDEAIGFRGQGSGSLFFYNPKTATSEWIKSRTVTVVIGNHTFAK
ncbi:cell wall hydrolase [Priestia aryabhattai]|uniref:cell wall hydrolase n=1 Tax=Priestia megaterium TaxID=1404 RepID=UPI003F955DD1